MNVEIGEAIKERVEEPLAERLMVVRRAKQYHGYDGDVNQDKNHERPELAFAETVGKQNHASNPSKYL